MTDLSGFLPENQAVNILLASWVLPCLGGKLIIKRLIRPASSSSKAAHMTSWNRWTS